MESTTVITRCLILSIVLQATSMSTAVPAEMIKCIDGKYVDSEHLCNQETRRSVNFSEGNFT